CFAVMVGAPAGPGPGGCHGTTPNHKQGEDRHTQHAEPASTPDGSPGTVVGYHGFLRFRLNGLCWPDPGCATRPETLTVSIGQNRREPSALFQHAPGSGSIWPASPSWFTLPWVAPPEVRSFRTADVRPRSVSQAHSRAAILRLLDSSPFST